MEPLAAVGNELSETPCLILAGGKTWPPIDIGGRLLLDRLLEWLFAQGVRQVTLCGPEGVRAAVLRHRQSRRWPHLTFSVESCPQGTWGAIRLARRVGNLSRPFLVLNGDTWMDADLSGMLQRQREMAALGMLALVPVPDTRRGGRVECGANGRLQSFREKSAGGPGLLNAGVYALDPAIFELAPAAPGWLERDVFPALLDEPVFGMTMRGPLFDPGARQTERYVTEDSRPALPMMPGMGNRREMEQHA